MDFFAPITPAQVRDSRTFATYVQQELGVPYPRQKDWASLNKQIQVLFKQYDNANWFTLCRIVDWCKANHKRYATIPGVVTAFRYAWRDGYLPELDKRHQKQDEMIENAIHRALQVESDEQWRRRFLRATGEYRKEVLEAWLEMRTSSLFPV